METYIVKLINNQLFLFKKDKQIGLIYPGTKGVKEGDEFNEEEVVITEECPHYNGKHMWKDCSCKIGFVQGVYIKGHF